MASRKKNPLQHWIASINPNEPYLLLLEHSLSYKLRQQASYDDPDASSYRRAGLLTPAESAARDLSGRLWLEYIYAEFSKHDTQPQWISTLNGSRDLDEPTCRPPIVLDSLTPLCMKHGFSKCFALIRKVLAKGPIVVSILVDTLTPHQIRQLEDAAHGLLWLHNGEMTMVRQGIRERANLVRETIPFSIQDSVLVFDMSAMDSQEPRKEKGSPLTTTTTPTATSTRMNGKIKLELESDETPLAQKSTPTPRIFLQDDDPEFDDYDEEDPDEDLDI